MDMNVIDAEQSEPVPPSPEPSEPPGMGVRLRPYLVIVGVLAAAAGQFMLASTTLDAHGLWVTQGIAVALLLLGAVAFALGSPPPDWPTADLAPAGAQAETAGGATPAGLRRWLRGSGP